MEINKSQAAFLLEAIKSKQINLSYAQIIAGVNLTDEIKSLVSALEQIVNPVTVADTTAEVSTISQSEISPS